MPNPEDCPNCGGTTWRSTPDGTVVRCPCLAAQLPHELEMRSGIPQQFASARFESLEMANGQMADAVLAVGAYARHYPVTSQPGVLLIGPTGVGKTHLAVAAIRQMMTNGHECLFLNYLQFLESLRAGYQEKGPNKTFSAAMETKVLLIDDLGAHRMTEWVEDTVTAIIQHRYDHRLPLIATTNLPLTKPAGDFRETLGERIGERCCSRLQEMCQVVRLGGEDYRTRKGKGTRYGG